MSIQIADHVRDIPRSGIRDFFEIVQSMSDVISLGIGEPDFATPWHIREAAIYSLEKGHSAVDWSTHSRSSGGLWLGEVVATAGLLLVIFGVVRSGRGSVAPFAVGAYIGAAYFFTSSTSFANPAVTIGRMFTNTFAGIDPTDVPWFIVFQLVGGAIAVVLVRLLYPDIADDLPDLIVAHHDERTQQ